MRWRSAYVAHVQARQGGAGLGCVLGLLALAQGGDVFDDALEVGIVHGRLGRGEFGLFLARGRGVVGHGDELDERAMLALEDELTQQVLEVGPVEFAIELLVDGAVLDATRGGLVGVVVEPGAERVAGERDD